MLKNGLTHRIMMKAFQSLNSKQRLKSVEDLSPKNLSNI